MNTTAKVTLTVEVDAGSWGPECKLDQVFSQAASGAEGALRAMFLKNSNVRLVGRPSVTAVLVKEKG